jgi:hypothetical protein
MRSAAFVQLVCIGLHPAPNATGIHLDTTFGQQFGDVLVGERLLQIPATHKTITSPGCWRPLNGLCKLIGMEFYPIRMPAPKFATERPWRSRGAVIIAALGEQVFDARPRSAPRE